VERQSDTTRAAVLAASTTLSALRQARDHAAAARDRVAAERERLALESRELAAEARRARESHAAATSALAAARESHAVVAATRAQAEADLAARRTERDRLSPIVAERQRQLAGREARLHSLEELDARRATFGDAARVLLAEAGEAIRQRGAVADHLVVDRSYERAVDALLGDTLQHVLVETHEDVEVGFALLSGHDAGRGGFVVLQAATAAATSPEPVVVPPGARALADVVRAAGPYAAVIARLIGRALIVDTLATARTLAASVSVPVATRTGEVFNGGWLVHGGSRREVRGILETRAEVQTLRDEVAAAHIEIDRLAAELSALEAAIAAGEAAVAGLVTDQHDQEKAIVGHQA
jgi:chromosome segregation protein